MNEIPKPIKCEFCGKEVYSKGSIIFNFVHWFTPVCDCEESRKAQEIERAKKEEERKQKELEEKRLAQKLKIEKLFADSGMGRRFKNRTFEDFTVNTKNQNAYNIAKAFVANFEIAEKEGTGIMFIGNYGTGKTHLACSIANELINKNIPVLYRTSIELLAKLRETYDNNYGMTEWQALDTYTNVDLLIIDDLGKEKPSEWVLEKLYYIINQRYENLKPIIITSNYNANEDLVKRLSTNNNTSTAEAIISRLSEMCTGVSVQGEDYRKK